jgi:hypothetical protein
VRWSVSTFLCATLIYHRMAGWLLNRKAVETWWKYYASSCLEEQRKTTKNLRSPAGRVEDYETEKSGLGPNRAVEPLMDEWFSFNLRLIARDHFSQVFRISGHGSRECPLHPTANRTTALNQCPLWAVSDNAVDPIYWQKWQQGSTFQNPFKVWWCVRLLCWI